MPVLNIKWETEEEKNMIKLQLLEKIEQLVADVAICLWKSNDIDIITLRDSRGDTRAAIRAYRLLFNEDLEYEVSLCKVIFKNLTTHAVIRTFTRKEVINND